ncbi:cytochrome D ubiquinol oxidase subunit I [Alcanivorax sp. HI0033]|nr:cytochrome D ubiquinol oxidase subunit I [Alcanivorax sp. HI0003]KZX73021.1 cytochrome D ubiquinol oxidase subunit I [Alcanivorax sp. HI0007]KZX81313.1 cytochrome D ubiquinol oxidase subunit I [Alcanivorax sp. HI0011]KZX87549.1 cytochrome D ubiquinol oxidase subunit I [Alcanivorax sp. HI0013]KZY05803.1 cytochrome D ubiquinol oxidase subunit I [Alcanivorax sp. HI0033]KZY21047.1 cytochrome D ubiquinol oxidase subunit I [Alcanivorax sp. HI0035]MEE3387630.1 cytochrome ubiquinol oxidase subunit
MEFDPFLLARLQFAANISFHILFPTITIGLCWVLFYFRLRYTFSGDKAWEYAYFFWVKIFALSFALGVVSGITMSFQFGTNWPGFMERAGNIAGPLLGYEVLTAFFLEASFLGIMLFGKDRVSNRTHLIATALVAVGTSFSAFWILSLNSWMQTPTGYRIEDGVFFVESWWEVIFNPSFPYRFAHMFTASLLTAAFLIMGISAWRAMRGVDGPATWKVMRTGALMAAVLAPLQVVIGDLHGLNTLEHQPAKIAAMEGIWETEKGAPLTLFGFPDEEEKTTHMAIKVPKLASFILTHEWDGEVLGLNEFEGEAPPVAPVFWAFRVMVGIGMLMVLVGWWSAWRLFRNRDENRDTQTWLLRALSVMTFSGWVAVLAGWYVTEIGRQPWIVDGLLRTSEVVADHSSATVAGTLFGYVLLYLFLLVSYIATLRYMATKPARSLTLTPQQRAMNDAETAEGGA